MIKIAFINQRYGLEVNGGSEYYTRLIAEKLKNHYKVEILTTRALDYVTWRNYYEEGTQYVNEIPVRRFSVEKERNMDEFSKENAILLADTNRTQEQELKWVDEQGPYSVDLVEYINKHQDDYDIFIFVTYLYYNTVKGLPLVAKKSILIPTAHDEPYIYFGIFDRIFTMPKAMIFLTEEERKFVHGRFHNSDIVNDVMGVGIEISQKVNPDAFRIKYNIKEEYLVYVGRIDYGKSCDWLLTYYMEYKKRQPAKKLKLVLMGKAEIEIPDHPDIISLGFVSEEDKYNGIAGAKALILPSMFESLSISVLEAMRLSIPVIVNGQCEVLKGHCIKSKAGLYYTNYLEFEEVINFLFKYDGIYYQMKNNAVKYVNDNFQWEIIIEKFHKIISYVIDKSESETCG